MDVSFEFGMEKKGEGRREKTYAATEMETVRKCGFVFDCFLLFEFVEFEGGECDHYCCVLEICFFFSSFVFPQDIQLLSLLSFLTLNSSFLTNL